MESIRLGHGLFLHDLGSRLRGHDHANLRSAEGSRPASRMAAVATCLDLLRERRLRLFERRPLFEKKESAAVLASQQRG